MDQRIAKLVNFNIAHKDEYRVEAQWTVSENLPSFEGHFPGNPILPAVSIIDISLHLLSLTQSKVSFEKIQVKRSKFMSFVRPNQLIDIVAESEDGNDWNIYWKQADNQSKLAQIHLVL